MRKRLFDLDIFIILFWKSIAQSPIPISSVEDLRGIWIDADKPMNGDYEWVDTGKSTV
jgi:hypothetical protein